MAFIQTRNLRSSRGFTLIELLVVIGIIAVLAALILASLSSAQKGSRDSRRKSDLSQYKTALAQLSADNSGIYPVQETATGMASNNLPYINGAGPQLAGVFLTTFIDDPKTPGNYIYVTDAAGSNFGICVDLERIAGKMFTVGPTFSGDKDQAACTPQG